MIKLENIERLFQVGDQIVHALDGINLEITSGEYITIMGTSGSGKSTLLNILGLLDRPTHGRYLLDAHDVTLLSDDEQAQVRQLRIGFVFQFFHLIPRLTAAANIELPMVLAGIEPQERTARVQDVLQAVGLTDRADHRPDQLSGGQRQRVAIARATVMGPAVLLADEPTGNLDSVSGKDVIELLEKLNNDGITLIIVTHDEEIGQRASRRIHMLDGKVISDVKKQSPR